AVAVGGRGGRRRGGRKVCKGEMKSNVGDPGQWPEFGGPIPPCGTRSHGARSTDPPALQARKNARPDSGRQSEVVSADSHVCHLNLADRHRRNEHTETQSPAPKYVVG